MMQMKAVSCSSSDLGHHVLVEVLPLSSWEGQCVARDSGELLMM